MDNRARQGRAAQFWPVAAVIAFGAAAAFLPQVLNDGDTFWHLATGRWMITQRAVPFADPFSHSVPGRAWYAHEWLAELLMALSWRIAGWAGVHLLFAAAMAMLAAVLAGEARRWLRPPEGLAALALVFGCLAGSLLARPHLLALPVLALSTRTLLRAVDDGDPPPWRLLPLMTLWANLHGSFLLGLGIATMLALEGARDRRGRIGWAAFLGAAVVAACLNPRGPEVFTLPLTIMHMSILPQIVEWRAADFTRLGPFEIGLLATLFILLRRGARLSIPRLLLLLALLHLALAQTRQQPVFACVALLLLARPIGDTGGEAGSVPALWPVLAPALAILAVIRLAVPATVREGPTAPVAALAAVPPELRARPVFNDYGTGGYLIFAGVRPFIDGRADMYGDAFVTQALAAETDPARLRRLLDDWHIAWTILPSGGAAARGLDTTPGWRRIHSDRFAAIHVRTTNP